MSLVDAARRLASLDPTGLRPALYADGDKAYCHWCEREGDGWGEIPLEHDPSCPWLQMPAIVAALEAAEKVLTVYGRPADHAYVHCGHPTTQQGGEGCHIFASCHHLYPSRCEFMPHEHPHQEDLWTVLRAALKGDHEPR